MLWREANGDYSLERKKVWHEPNIECYSIRDWLESPVEIVTQAAGAFRLDTDWGSTSFSTVHTHKLLERSNEWLIKFSSQCHAHICKNVIHTLVTTRYSVDQSNSATLERSLANAIIHHWRSRKGHDKSTNLKSYMLLLHVENLTILGVFGNYSFLLILSIKITRSGDSWFAY